MKALKNVVIRISLIPYSLNKSGMEMVQVAILVAIAVAIGLIFKGSITKFVNQIFDNLNSANF